MQPWGIQQAPPPEHVYRYTLRSPRVLASWLIAYPIALATMFALNGLLPPHHFRLDPFVAVGALIGMFIGFALSERATTLTVTPAGIFYQRAKRTTWVVWSDIEAIRPWSRGYYGWLSGEGLVIRSDALPGARRRTFSRSFIPVSLFARRWRESPLGDDVRRYAPWLFSQTGDPWMRASTECRA